MQTLELVHDLLPKQHEYINSTADTAIYCGGVGAGKSIADVTLAMHYAINYPGIEILVCSPTYGMLRDTIIREFRSHCPHGLIEKQTWGVYPEVIFKKNYGKQSKIRFRAFDDAGKPKGLTIGLLIGDEITEMREDVFNELIFRVRQSGMPNHKRFSTNPDSKNHFIYKRYIEPYERGDLTQPDFHYIHTETFDNYTLPGNYIQQMQKLAELRPGQYRRSVLGEWGDFDEDSIGAFQKIPRFTAEYLVAFLDTSFSDSTVSDRTALSIVGFTANEEEKDRYYKIEFTGKSWQKSVTHSDVIHDMIRFLDKFRPIEVCVESQLGDSTQIFIDRFKQAEKDIGVDPKNYWTVLHQTKNKHERIMLHVAGNKDRLQVLDGTDSNYLNPIISYTKKSDHDDEPDSLAGAINLWQTSPVLRNYVYNLEQLRKMRA